MNMERKIPDRAAAWLRGTLGMFMIAGALAAQQPRTVPAGTPLKLQLETRLSTADNRDGDGFAARVMVGVYYQGHEVIPEGSIVEGHVVEVKDSRPAVRDSELLLRPDLLSTPDGTQYRISADVMQVENGGGTHVDNEGGVHGERGPNGSDAKHAAIGVSTGAIVGAVLVGGKAALIGGGVGAAIAGGLWLLRKRHLELKPGAHIVIRLDRPVTLTPKKTVSR